MTGDALVVANVRGAHVGPVDLVVAAGTCAAISGPSGAGKSLLLRAIADLDPNSGEVRLGAIRRDLLPGPEWRRRVMYLAAEAGWWADTAGAHFPPQTLVEARLRADRLGLAPDVFERPVRVLSTGERQRLALLRALARRPGALLLDEPTSALDTTATAGVEDLLHAALADTRLTVVLVTHDLTQARRVGARRYTMTAGQLAAAPDERSA